jgi:hypothetical protein
MLRSDKPLYNLTGIKKAPTFEVVSFQIIVHPTYLPARGGLIVVKLYLFGNLKRKTI